MNPFVFAQMLCEVSGLATSPQDLVPQSCHERCAAALRQALGGRSPK
jgi:hypothetical protein